MLIQGRKYLAGSIAAFFLFAAGGPQAYAQEPKARKAASAEVLEIQRSFSKVAEKIQPAVVNVTSVMEMEIPEYEFYFSPDGKSEERGKKGGQKRRVQALASGVIVDPRGFVLTSAHVIQDAKSIRVILANNEKYNGKVVGRNARGDIAVIKIEAGKELPFAKLGDSDKLNVGDWAVAFGSPFGLSATLTVGVISAKRQALKIEGVEFPDLIQTDAPINEGNSGGPLCNIDGEVIGINTAIYAPTGVFSGIGFALPVNNVKEILTELCKTGAVPCPVPTK